MKIKVEGSNRDTEVGTENNRDREVYKENKGTREQQGQRGRAREQQGQRGKRKVAEETAETTPHQKGQRDRDITNKTD